MPQDSANKTRSNASPVTASTTPSGASKAFRLPALAASLALVLGVVAHIPEPVEASGFQIPANDPAFRSKVYAGVGLGASNLDPDTSGTSFSVGGSGDSGSQLRIGADLHNMLAVEIESSVLGAASLREAPAEVSFSAVSLSALVYGLNGVQMRSRREGLSAYGRLGFARIAKASQVITLDKGTTGVVLGLGAEYGFANGLGVRGELTRFSSEATYFGLNVIYRFGHSPGQLRTLIADSVRPALETEDTYVVDGGRSVVSSNRFGSEQDRPATTADQPQTAPVAENLPTMRVATGTSITANDGDGDSISDADDTCLDTPRGVTVADNGCGLFDAVLGDVRFDRGSTKLNARARGALDHIVSQLLAFPEVRVEVRGHTDSRGSADDNLALSSRRAEAVVWYLRVNGVPEIQLEGRGKGESQPIASNRSESGRSLNRRIELVTLANLDRAVLEGRQVRGNVWQYPLTTTARDALKRETDVELGTAPAARPATEAVSAVSNTESVDTDQENGTDEPDLGAAVSSRGGVPPIGGLKPVALPPQGYLLGFNVTGVVDGLGFASGSDEISESGRAAVERISRAMNQHPSARIAVMAHTDNTGEQEVNLELSQQRAQRVVDALVDAGIDPDRLRPEGYGDSLPLVQNMTEADRARNRRIEIRLTR